MNDLPLRDRLPRLPDPTILKQFENAFDDAADATGRTDPHHRQDPPVAGDATECSQLQHRENDFTAAASDPTQCSKLHHSKNDSPDAPVSDAAECSELQQRKSDFHAAGEEPNPPTAESPPESEPSDGLPDDFAGSLTNFARMILSPRQQSAIQLLVAGETDRAVAHKLGVDRTTIWRWKRHRHFRAVLDEARELVFGAAVVSAQASLPFVPIRTGSARRCAQSRQSAAIATGTTRRGGGQIDVDALRRFQYSAVRNLTTNREFLR